MDIVGTPFFWVTLAQIIMINIVLSGDNAVVIALASRSLPPRQQKRAILFGSFGAIILRVILTFFAVLLLGLPYLKIIGAALLGWIGIQMLAPDSEEEEISASTQLWAATSAPSSWATTGEHSRRTPQPVTLPSAGHGWWCPPCRPPPPWRRPSSPTTSCTGPGTCSSSSRRSPTWS